MQSRALSISSAGGLIAWVILVAWCVHSFPPSMDLPAHAAQIQTLAELLSGNASVADYYRLTFPVGYGGTTWLFAPIAMVTNGATAARVAIGLAVGLLPLAHAALARALGLSPWVAVLAAPLAFGTSYSFGFLPTAFALPWVLLGWAVLIHSLETPRLRPAVALGAISLFVLLMHVLTWAVLVFGLLAVALTARKPKGVVGWLLAALLPSILAALPIVWVMLQRALTAGSEVPMKYQWAGRFVWHLKTAGLGLEGRLGVWLMVATVAAFVISRLAVRPQARDSGAVLFLATLILYLLTPKSMSHAYYIDVRASVLVGLTALLLFDLRKMGRQVQVLLAVSVAVSLVIVVRRHLWFAQQIEGFAEVIRTPPRGVHGGLSLVGNRLPPARIEYLEHMAQWWTAQHGGVGHHFFADADHQPVRFSAGRELPQRIEPGSPAQVFEPFQELLVFGEGDWPSIEGFREVQRSGRWRRFERTPN